MDIMIPIDEFISQEDIEEALKENRKMREAEIAETMQMTLPELISLCRNRATAKIVLSLAIQRGIEKGRAESHRYYGMLFKGYNGVSVQN